MSDPVQDPKELGVFCKDCGKLSPAESKKCSHCGSENVAEIPQPSEAEKDFFAAPAKDADMRGPMGEPMFAPPLDPNVTIIIVD